MADEVSAFASYYKKAKKVNNKQAPKKMTKQATKKPPNKKAKQLPKTAVNGAVKKMGKNGGHLANSGKMSHATDSTNCSSYATGSETSSDFDEKNTTAEMARKMVKLVDKCAKGARSLNGIGDSNASDDSGGSDYTDVSDEVTGDEDGYDYEEGESDQFSEEYTPNESSSSGQSLPAATLPPQQRRSTGQKRSQTTDTNTNNKNKNGPTAAKQQKMQPSTAAEKVKPTATTAPTTKATAKTSRLSDAVKSCPLPKKDNVKSAPKSSPLPPKLVAKVKSCPLPKQPKEKPKQPKEKPKQSKEQPKQPKEQPKQSKEQPKQKTAEVIAKKKSDVQPTETPVEAAAARKEVHLQNSIEEGKRVLDWLLNPITTETFFDQYWETNACQVIRKQPNYFSKLISFKMIDELLIKNHLEFTTNIDVTSYTNGQRQTHNPDGRAMPPSVWSFYGDGCSVRIINPNTYLPALRQVCAVMQEYFHCLVGANVYLTPPHSQGFAPHYDDIEAFVLQVEGRKRWRLYVPPKPSDQLCRTSSGNFKQEDLGEPIFDAVLSPGDILYFPRGTVHQAVTEKNHHSLHITLSVYQQQAYANLMEELLPKVLQGAINKHLTLRRGLPLNIWGHVGLAHSMTNSKERSEIIQTVNQMVQKYLLPHESQIDAAVDQLAKRFQHEALPPVLQPEEKLRTVFGSRSETDEHGNCLADYELDERTKVRLLRANVVRLIAEESSIRVYYYVDNALEYRKYEANYMEIQPNEVPTVEALIKAYPKYLSISELPLRTAERRIEVATALWEHGLLMTEKPFK